MELLISALVTVLVNILKKLENKYGFKSGSSAILILAFVLSAATTFLYKHFTTGIDWTNMESIISVFGVSIAYYEVVVKRLIQPALQKFNKK